MASLAGIIGSVKSGGAGFNWSGTDILPGGLDQLTDFLAGGKHLSDAAAGLLGSGELAAQAAALDGSAFVQLGYDTDAPVPPGQCGCGVTAWTLDITAGAIWQDAAAQFGGSLELLFQKDGGVDVSFNGGAEPYAPPVHVLDDGTLIG